MDDCFRGGGQLAADVAPLSLHPGRDGNAGNCFVIVPPVIDCFLQGFAVYSNGTRRRVQSAVVFVRIDGGLSSHSSLCLFVLLSTNFFLNALFKLSKEGTAVHFTHVDYQNQGSLPV